MKDYDYLSLIIEISPQKQSSPEDVEDYEKVCKLDGDGDHNAILEFTSVH